MEQNVGRPGGMVNIVEVSRLRANYFSTLLRILRSPFENLRDFSEFVEEATERKPMIKTYPFMLSLPKHYSFRQAAKKLWRPVAQLFPATRSPLGPRPKQPEACLDFQGRAAWQSRDWQRQRFVCLRALQACSDFLSPRRSGAVPCRGQLEVLSTYRR